MKVQFEELNSELKLKDEKLKKFKEDNRLLLKRVAESKESRMPAVDGNNTVCMHVTKNNSFKTVLNITQDLYPVKYGLLGGGSYGEVHRVHYKTVLYAGKIIHARLLPGYPNILKEDLSKLFIQFSTKCSSIASNFFHPNVEQFIDVARVSADGVPVIITELLTESLTSYLTHSRISIFTDQQLGLCLDMTQGINYLHSRSLVHKNLHGGNVLMTNDGHAKIADYLCPQLISDVVGNSSGYMPPEVLRQKYYSNQSNVFTLGVLFLQVTTGYLSQPSTDTSLQSEVEQRRNDLDSVPSVHPLLSCIKQCLKDDEVARPQIKEVCDLINQLIVQKDHPEMIAYKLLYTNEHVSQMIL